MKFLNKEVLSEIERISFERAKDFYNIHYTKIDLFNEAKEIMLRASVTKPTWYSLMNKIQEKSINSKEQFISTTMPLNLLQMVHEIFIETGELIDIEDIRNILYAYEDYCPNHLELAVHQHFSIQNFVKDLYRLKVNQFLAEILSLSDFVVLKMCPNELMNAQIVTIETCIKYAKQEGDIETGIAIAKYGKSLLIKDTFTWKYCDNFLKRNLK